MILINKTYTEVTPESAEQGEFSDSGFVFEDAEYSFRELIEELEKHSQPSCSCLHNNYDNVWFSSDFEIEDYCTMTERQESLHYSRNNDARSKKYWMKAINYVYGVK